MKLTWEPILQRDDSSALIAGSAQLASTAINGMIASGTSSRDRDFTKEMWQKNRDAALADRDYANAYNLPSAQMARLKAAGLNANLIYGKAGADMSSQPVRGADAPVFHRTPFSIDAGGAVGTYFQIQSQQAQLANIKQQNALIQAQTDYANAQTEAVKAQTPGYQAESGIKSINLDIAGQTKDAKIQIENGKVIELQANIAKTLTDTTVEQLKALPSVELMVTEAAKNIKETELLQSKKLEVDAIIPKLQAEAKIADSELQYMNKNNMKMPQSNMMWSFASALLNKAFPNKEDAPHKSYPTLQNTEQPMEDYFNKQHMNEMMNAPVPWRKR